TLNCCLCLCRIFWQLFLTEVVSQVMRDGEWQGEPAINRCRQQGVSTQAVSTVVGPRCLTCCEQTVNGSHLIEVGPQTTHREVASRCNTHWGFVCRLTNCFLIHLNEVGVTLTDGVFTQTLDGVAEVKVNRVLQWTNAVAGIDLLRNSTGCNVTGNEVAERRVAALQEVVALFIRNGIRLAVVALLLWRQGAAVLAQRLRHENGFGLPSRAQRQPRLVEVRKCWGSKERSLLVCTHQSACIRVLSQSGHMVHVAVATGTQDNCVTGMSLELTGDQVTCNDAAGALLTVVLKGNNVLHI